MIRLVSDKRGNLDTDTHIHRKMPFEHEERCWSDNVLTTQGTPKIGSQPPDAR